MISLALLFGDLLLLNYVYNVRQCYPFLNDFQIIVGHNNKFIGRKALVVDMLQTPHLLVCGLSGNGKSKMVEYCLKDKQCVILNAFQEDYSTLDCPKIPFVDDIVIYLQGLLTNPVKLDTPLYVAIDELLILNYNKTASELVKQLLLIGRHYNIFVIGITQVAQKENLKFKDLFNSRITFRQIEESNYRCVLGYSPVDTNLKKQEFFLYTNNSYKGKTYNI